MARHRQPERRWLAWTVRLALLAGAVGAWVMLSSGDGWLGRALTSQRFIIGGLGLLAGVFVVESLCRCLARWGRRQRTETALPTQAGAAMIEFALVLPILLTISLVLAQTAFVLVGTMAVNYAAFCAARSAVVTVPEDMSYESGEEPNYVYYDAEASAKVQRIRQAAVWAVMPVSAAHPELNESGMSLVDGSIVLYDAYGMDVPRWVYRMLGRKMTYADRYTEVQLDPPVDGDYYGENELIGVHVRHQLYLGIPFGNWIYAQMDPSGSSLEFDPAVYSVEIHALGLLPNEGVRDYIEEETFDP